MPTLTLPKSKCRRVLGCVLALLCLGVLLGGAAVAVVNGIVIGSTEARVLSLDEAATLTDVDYILVLGAGVRADGSPSDMLHDRVLTAVDVCAAGLVTPLLMSGDNQRPEYDEVSAMIALAVTLGVEESAVEADRLGLSTYESLERARERFDAERILIVTQKYHLYRALYVAEQMGMEAYGLSADVRGYRGQIVRDVREVAARCKDFILVHWMK